MNKTMKYDMVQNDILGNVEQAFINKGADKNIDAYLFKRDKNSATALRAEKKDKERVLDLSAVDNIIGSLGKMGYVPGSKVAIIIATTCSCEALKDMDLNKQFLTDGKVDMFKLAALFPQVGAEAEADGYKRIFSEKEFIAVTDKTGRSQDILLSCKDRIETFKQQIKELRSCSQEELVLIGKDLEVVATVMSELEIDAAKDESKREGMIDINEFMNVRTKQRGRQITVINNFKDIVSFKKGYSKESVSKFVYELKKEFTLFDFDKLYAERKEEFYNEIKENGKTLTEAEEKKELFILKKNVREECMILDPLFEIVEMMLEAVKGTLENFTVFYKNSNMNLFEDLFVSAERDEEANLFENETLEEAIFSVRKTAVIVYEIINNVFTYGKLMSMAKPSDIAKIGRNIIYTAGEARGFSPEDTFLMCVDAGWYKRYVKNGKELLQKSDFKYKAVEAVFGTELKYYFNADAMRKEANLEIPKELLSLGIFEEGTILAFEDGQCIIETEEDEYSILRVDDTEYTGSILLEVDEEGYAVFVEDVDPYEYEVVDYVVFDNIGDANSRMDAVKFESLFVEAETEDNVFAKEYKKSRLYPKRKSEENGNGFLSDKEKAAEAKRVAPMLEKWEQTMELECSYGLKCNVNQKHYCLSSENAGVILGKVHDSFMQEDEYEAIHSISTSVGALAIKIPFEEVEEA